MTSSNLDGNAQYERSKDEEIHIYDRCLDVHDLPLIFHYWSTRHIQPKLRPFGFSSPNGMFRKYLEEKLEPGDTRIRRFLSLGAGNCDLEIDIAAWLVSQGRVNFQMDCLDLSAVALERARSRAAEAGLADRFRFLECDFNAWEPETEYDTVLANQSLHHVVALEHLLDGIGRSLRSGGSFLISDIIGRNGHLRWPEALDLVEEFWGLLPPSYRFNHRLQRYEARFEDWDCSRSGFEGIRSQDILPLLMERFHFRLFVPFGNVIDPFVDRTFGPNFDASTPWDRAFIDRVHGRDEEAITSGLIKPTHMLAVVTREPDSAPCHFPGHLSPRFSVRIPAPVPQHTTQSGAVTYQWGSWPHEPDRELRRAVERLEHSAEHLKMQAREIEQLEGQLDERTAWARDLDRDAAQRRDWALEIEEQLKLRTAWALQLEKSLADCTERAGVLQEELQQRTSWALGLAAQLEERTAWALRLSEAEKRRQEEALRRPGFLGRFFHGCFQALAVVVVRVKLIFS